MRVLVTGAAGMLGACLAQTWQKKFEVFATGRTNFAGIPVKNFFEKDLADESYEDLLSWSQPDVIVHCAALTNVDYCEDHPEEAFKINTESVSKLLDGGSARMLFISSDAVFADGIPMATEEHEAQPESVYGMTKRDAEEVLLKTGSHHLAIRTTIVGKNLNPDKRGFAEWIVQSLQSGSDITLFEDALFTPISIWDLAAELEYLIRSDLKGVLHVSGSEGVSKYDFGKKICEGLSLDASLIKKGSIRNMNFKAKRSSDQTLSSDYYQTQTGRRLPTVDQTVNSILKAFQN